MAQISRRSTARGGVRYDVRLRIGGRVVTRSFLRRRDAEAFANTMESDKARGTAVDPRHGRVTVKEWSRKWLAQRPDLRPKTRALYHYLLEDYVIPGLGGVELGKLTVSAVRSWHGLLLTKKPAIAPKAYQVLRVSLNAAVEDGIIAVNPCKIRGAGQSRPMERPLASPADVEILAGAINERYRAMVLLAFWCGLRLGELRGLRRSDLDLLHRWVHVREQVVDVSGQLLTGPPKTDAGRRRVAIPRQLVSTLEDHLERFVTADVTSYVFTGTHGVGPLPSATWKRSWDEARRGTDLPHLHFHDLRHAGNTLAAATGASTRELMARMGHSSPRAALIYQHATSERDQAIADALADLADRRTREANPTVPRDGRAMES